MTSRTTSQCILCAHWTSPLARDVDEAEPTQICTAFPGGIPDEIWWNRADHRKPFAGDGGIRWAPVDKGDVYPG